MFSDGSKVRLRPLSLKKTNLDIGNKFHVFFFFEVAQVYLRSEGCRV